MSGIATRECGALTSSGNPCRRGCAPGHTRCNLHGGHTPLARQAASEALAKAALPSAAALLDIVSSYGRERCDKCGQPTGDPSPVIRAAQLILDRTGFHPTLTVQTQTAEAPRHMAWIPHERLVQMNAWLEEAKEAMARGEQPADELPVIELQATPVTDSEDWRDHPVD